LTIAMLRDAAPGIYGETQADTFTTLDAWASELGF